MENKYEEFYRCPYCYKVVSLIVTTDSRIISAGVVNYSMSCRCGLYKCIDFIRSSHNTDILQHIPDFLGKSQAILYKPNIEKRWYCPFCYSIIPFSIKRYSFNTRVMGCRNCKTDLFDKKYTDIEIDKFKESVSIDFYDGVGIEGLLDKMIYYDSIPKLIFLIRREAYMNLTPCYKELGICPYCCKVAIIRVYMSFYATSTVRYKISCECGLIKYLDYVLPSKHADPLKFLPDFLGHSQDILYKPNIKKKWYCPFCFHDNTFCAPNIINDHNINFEIAAGCRLCGTSLISKHYTNIEFDKFKENNSGSILLSGNRLLEDPLDKMIYYDSIPKRIF